MSSFVPTEQHLVHMQIYKARWFDMDSNGHMGHTSYGQFAGQARIDVLAQEGITQTLFKEHNIGPILMEEKLNYYQEVMMGEEVRVYTEILHLDEGARKVKMRHYLVKDNDEVACTVEAFMMWLDLEKRKTTTPPHLVFEGLNRIAKST